MILERLKAWVLRRLTGRPERVYYIGGSDVLPPPLSRAAEAAALAELAAGS